MHRVGRRTARKRTLRYGDVFHQNEVEQSTYNFEHSNAPKLFELFSFYESEAKRLLDAKLPLPGYEMILKAAHTFNLLDARGAISVTERAAYIGRIRTLSRLVAQGYVESREALGFPMLPPELRKDRRMSAQGRPSANGPEAHSAEGSPVSAMNLLVELFTEELPPKALKQPRASIRQRSDRTPSQRATISETPPRP